MTDLILTEQTHFLLFKQRQVYKYALDLMNSMGDSEINIDSRIADYNIFELFLNTHLLKDLAQLLGQLYPRMQEVNPQFHMSYFLVENEEQLVEEYKQLVSLQLPCQLPMIITDQSYFDLINGFFNLFEFINNFDNTPTQDFKFYGTYEPNDYEIKLAINLLGERALDEIQVNRHNKCCGV